MSSMPSTSRLIVCEHSGRWALLLRRKAAEARIRVWETRTLVECREEVASSPTSVVVIELTANNLAELLKTVGSWDRDYPLLRWVAVTDRSLADYEWLLREAGAVHFICSPRQSDGLVQIVCRHFAQIPQSAQSLADRIWASLPWEKK